MKKDYTMSVSDPKFILNALNEFRNIISDHQEALNELQKSISDVVDTVVMVSNKLDTHLLGHQRTQNVDEDGEYETPENIDLAEVQEEINNINKTVENLASQIEENDTKINELREEMDMLHAIFDKPN